MPIILNIFGEIERGWMDVDYVKSTLASGSPDEEVHIYINSPGGDAFEALAMYDLLLLSKRRIKAFVEGIAYSAASILLMAAEAEDRYMLRHSQVMIHEPMISAWNLRADELRSYADLLDALKIRLVDIYAERTGIAKDQVEEMLMAETFMDSTTAVELGVVGQVLTEVVQNKKSKNMKKDLMNLLASVRNLVVSISEDNTGTPVETSNDLEGNGNGEGAEQAEKTGNAPENGEGTGSPESQNGEGVSNGEGADAASGQEEEEDTIRELVVANSEAVQALAASLNNFMEVVNKAMGTPKNGPGFTPTQRATGKKDPLLERLEIRKKLREAV